MEENEEWKEIRGCPGYFVSRYGEVWNDKKQQPHPQHYKRDRFYVYLPSAHGELEKGVHTLVAEAFIGRKWKWSHVRHLDGDSMNNEADNLEWSQNARG